MVCFLIASPRDIQATTSLGRSAAGAHLPGKTLPGASLPKVRPCPDKAIRVPWQHAVSICFIFNEPRHDSQPFARRRQKAKAGPEPEPAGGCTGVVLRSRGCGQQRGWKGWPGWVTRKMDRPAPCQESVPVACSVPLQDPGRGRQRRGKGRNASPNPEDTQGSERLGVLAGHEGQAAGNRTLKTVPSPSRVDTSIFPPMDSIRP